MPNILCNGTPKAGTNLLVKAVRSFAPEMVHRSQHGHYKTPLDEATHDKFDRHVEIIRYPKNIIGSWFRFKDIPYTTRDFRVEIPIRMKSIREHLGWLSRDDVHVVKFEELLTDPQALEGIGEYLGLPTWGGQFNNLWGHTYTFTGKLTNYKDYWNPEVDALYRLHGGYELEEALGYKDHQTRQRHT